MENKILPVCLAVAVAGTLMMPPQAHGGLRRVLQQVGFYEDGKPEWKWADAAVAEPAGPKPVLNHSYEKHLRADGSFEIWFVSAGCTKRVNSDKPGYLEYVRAGHDVREIAYSAPAERAIGELRTLAAAKAEALKRGELESRTWTESKEKSELERMKSEISDMDRAQLEDFLR